MPLCCKFLPTASNPEKIEIKGKPNPEMPAKAIPISVKESLNASNIASGLNETSDTKPPDMSPNPPTAKPDNILLIALVNLVITTADKVSGATKLFTRAPKRSISFSNLSLNVPTASAAASPEARKSSKNLSNFAKEKPLVNASILLTTSSCALR